jgi:hypothetical protein
MIMARTKGTGAILPNKITSKHNVRYVPNMKGPDLIEKMKKQLIKNGYPDVEVKMIGDVPWGVAKLSGDLPKAQALDTGRRICSAALRRFRSRSRMRVPASAGMLTRPTSSTSSRVPGKVYGMAGAEKVQAAVLYSFAGKNQ